MNEDICYTRIKAGPNIGVPVFQINFKEQPNELGRVCEIVKEILNFNTGRNKNVYLKGPFPQCEEEILTLVKTLKDHNYKIIALTNGERFYTWFSLVDWLIVETSTNGRWTGFKCNELHYTIYSLDDPEPILSSAFKDTILYVESSSIDLFPFLRRAKYIWRASPFTPISLLKEG